MLSVCPEIAVDQHERFIPEVHRMGFVIYLD